MKIVDGDVWIKQNLYDVPLSSLIIWEMGSKVYKYKVLCMDPIIIQNIESNTMFIRQNNAWNSFEDQDIIDNK